MEELAKLEDERRNPSYLSDGTGEKRERVASNEMCTFLILNISSLQLIPVNILEYKDNPFLIDETGIYEMLYYVKIEKEGMSSYLNKMP